MRDGDPPASNSSPSPSLADFFSDPAARQSLELWRAVLAEDRRPPVHSHRGALGSLVVLFKRLLRPFVEAPQRELWERQRLLDLALLDHLQRANVPELWATVWKIAAAHDEKLGLLDRRLDVHEGAIVRAEERDRAGDEQLAAHDRKFSAVDGELAVRDQRLATHDLKFTSLDGDITAQDNRVGHLEKFLGEGVKQLMAHDDALFSLLDQKLDRTRREVRDLLATLQSALARSAAAGSPAPLAEAVDEAQYLELERRHRGTEGEIRERLAAYLPLLSALPGEVLDLGCGRGELLRLLRDHGIAARGVDSSAEMVRRCTEAGLRVEHGDLLAALEAAPPGSLGAVIASHVVEHLPAAVVDRLVRLAQAAIVPGGVLVLETPNPLSLVAGSRNFWTDPTHRRPVHPAALRLAVEQAGFDPVEVRSLRPFAAQERLPEIDLATVGEAQRDVADAVNRLRDRLDDLLFGDQDYAVIGRRPAQSP